ncbi:unnamed protein product, partial [Polarella glacialis]
ETSGSAEELAKLRGALEAQSADLELLQQRDQQDDAYREELQELRRNSEATEVRHREAEEQLRELRALLASSQQNSKAVLTAKTTDLEAKHSAEVRGLQSRVAAAEVQEQLAEAKVMNLLNQVPVRCCAHLVNIVVRNVFFNHNQSQKDRLLEVLGPLEKVRKWSKALWNNAKFVEWERLHHGGPQHAVVHLDCSAD